MKQKRRSMEEIIRIIRQADGGKSVREVLREHNVHEVTFHRWKRKAERSPGLSSQRTSTTHK